MAKKWTDVSLEAYRFEKPKDKNVTLTGTVNFQNPRGKQPDYTGEAELNIKGETIKLYLSVWQNTYNLKIRGTDENKY